MDMGMLPVLVYKWFMEQKGPGESVQNEKETKKHKLLIKKRLHFSEV